jgi:hypothetical protein
MYVKRQIGNGIDGADRIKAEAHVGHEHTVHYVAMKPIGAGSVRTADFVGKMKKITSQNGRGSQNFHSGSPDILENKFCRMESTFPAERQQLA